MKYPIVTYTIDSDKKKVVRKAIFYGCVDNEILLQDLSDDSPDGLFEVRIDIDTHQLAGLICDQLACYSVALDDYNRARRKQKRLRYIKIIASLILVIIIFLSAKLVPTENWWFLFPVIIIVKLLRKLL